jgi:hypothetical protein
MLILTQCLSHLVALPQEGKLIRVPSLFARHPNNDPHISTYPSEPCDRRQTSL